MDQRSGSGGGGCCIARYTPANPNYYSAAYDHSKMDRIMLRYRPIAPKPASGGATSTPAHEDAKSGGGRVKRKNSGGSCNSSGSSKRRKSRSPSDETRSDGNKTCHVARVTLPLLPESPDLVNQNRPIPKPMHQPMWLNFGGIEINYNNNGNIKEGVGTSVVVEGLTDTWVDGTGLGRTDEERRRRLDEDTCPGFISDGWDRVRWTNEAFRRLVVGGDLAVGVRLGVREKVELPRGKLFPAFTCRVRVHHGTHTMTVPCDVWRMDGGGFAWRLDLRAALSLGR